MNHTLPLVSLVNFTLIMSSIVNNIILQLNFLSYPISYNIRKELVVSGCQIVRNLLVKVCEGKHFIDNPWAAYILQLALECPGEQPFCRRAS